MADRRNYYEIIDKLSFDPIEMKDKKIIDAIEMWKLLEEKRGVSQEETNGGQRQQELDLYDDIKACLLDKTRRKEEAEAMKQKQKEILADIVLVLKNSSMSEDLYISNARLLDIAVALRLDKEKTVKKAFVDAGFEIIVRKNVKLDDYFISTTIINKLSKSIDELQGISSKDYPWLSRVNNLYDLAAFYKNDEANIETYHSSSADELKGIMESGAAAVAGKLDKLNHCLADLFNMGIMQIFKDAGTKKKYDNSLMLSDLQADFLLLRRLPNEMKKDPYIAGKIISKIKSKFDLDDVALDIYNRELNMLQDPYEPEADYYDLLCESCKTTTKIKYGEKNKTNCKCKACGVPLFIRCLNHKCDAIIPAIADICPECGFNMIESKNFSKYITIAVNAIETMNIDEARKYYALAQSARPNDPQLDAVGVKLKEYEGKYLVPLNRIKDLMNQKKYMQADSELAEFCSKFTGVKVDDIKEKITRTISTVDALFANIESQTDKCGVCFDILDKVSDYIKAEEYIKDKMPKEVSNVNATVSTQSNQVTLQWNGTGERKVTYCVVRKANTIPQNINDGVMVLKEQLVTQFVDSNIEPGTVYYYAVFAFRLGTYSKPTCSKPITLFRELDANLIIKTPGDGKNTISWQLPKNCKGIRVLRNDKGQANSLPGQNTIVVADGVTNGYEDKNVKNDVVYNYRLQCVYTVENGFQYSEGVTFQMRPAPAPQKATLISATVKSENAIQITWNVEHADSNAFLDIYDINVGVNVVEGTKYHVTELAKIGTKIATLSDISSKSAEIRVGQKKGYRITALIVKGEYAVISNMVSFSNYDKLEIDKTKTKITGGNLVIQLKDSFPQNLTNVRYAVATKNSDSEPAPWCSIENAPNMTQMSLVAYKTDGMIRIGKVPEKELYISVIGEYVVGKDVYYSEASKLRLSNRPKAVISYKLVWGFLNKKKNVKLIIECDSDQELPEMYLCTNKTIKVPMSPSAPNTVRICTIQEDLNYKAHTKIEIDIPNDIWSNTTKENEIRLFIPEDSYSEFRMAPEVETLRIP